MIVDEFILGNGTLEPIINDYIKAQAVLQTVSNPSGTFLPAGRGLGEPKYEADGTRFNGAVSTISNVFFLVHVTHGSGFKLLEKS